MGSGRMHNDGRTILYSGHEEQHVHGIGMVLNRQATKALICWKPVSDRIITTRFHLSQVKTIIVQVYAPIKDANDDVKDAFYDQLQDTINDTHNDRCVWRKGVIIKLPKKGDISDCNIWQGITLLSVPGKIFCPIMLKRLRDAVDATLREEQAGFRRGRSCTEQILHCATLLPSAWNPSSHCQ